MNEDHEAYKIPDDLWEKVRLLLPPTYSTPGSGLYMDARKAMAIVFYILRKGYKLEGIMDNLGDERAALQKRTKQWLKTGTFDRLWQVGVITLDELKMLVNIFME